MDIGVLSDFNAHISKDLSRVMVIDVPTLSKENNLKVLWSFYEGWAANSWRYAINVYAWGPADPCWTRSCAVASSKSRAVPDAFGLEEIETFSVRMDLTPPQACKRWGGRKRCRWQETANGGGLWSSLLHRFGTFRLRKRVKMQELAKKESHSFNLRDFAAKLCTKNHCLNVYIVYIWYFQSFMSCWDWQVFVFGLSRSWRKGKER